MTGIRMGQGKRKRMGAALLCAALLAGLICLYGSTQREEYVVFSQFSFGGGSYRQTVMNVLVYRRGADETLADRIVEEYRRVNGEHASDRLILRLYRNRQALRQGNYYKELLF